MKTPTFEQLVARRAAQHVAHRDVARVARRAGVAVGIVLGAIAAVMIYGGPT
ncbi:hypothetical protein [Microbacterium sp. IEGM 1404]|uniref:hypothetical protein n=1 Tax=Microbacterium sp. IEGM 1404 TaxID=3047084 RepID=UPI0024B7274A|nr:hypothetical protein [Microbacterium sp. IEGM 1404]MDI9889984.1 hypothetical protein [Microbacterium sp. IEGM 1404]